MSPFLPALVSRHPSRIDFLFWSIINPIRRDNHPYRPKMPKQSPKLVQICLPSPAVSRAELSRKQFKRQLRAESFRKRFGSTETGEYSNGCSNDFSRDYKMGRIVPPTNQLIHNTLDLAPIHSFHVYRYGQSVKEPPTHPSLVV